MNELGPQGPKYYILKHRLNSKNTIKLCVTYPFLSGKASGALFLQYPCQFIHLHGSYDASYKRQLSSSDNHI